MFKRPHYITLALVVVFTLVLLNLPARTSAHLKRGLGSIFLPLFGLAGSSREMAEKGANALTPRWELVRQNESLLRENQQLRLAAQRNDSVERENNRLRDLVGWQRQQKWHLRLARVIARDPANWWRTVQIDFGSSHGARENMPVLTTEGLVGRISAVNPAYSQVVLIGDPNCKVGARVENERRDVGIIGPGGPLDRELLELSYLAGSVNLKPGQKVRTSGEGGIFPRDLPIGTIIDSYPVEYGLYTVARVRLAASLSALDEVWVMLSPGENTTTTTRK